MFFTNTLYRRRFILDSRLDCSGSQQGGLEGVGEVLPTLKK